MPRINLLLSILIILVMYPEIDGFWMPRRPRLPLPRPRLRPQPHPHPHPRVPKPVPTPYVPIPNKPIPIGPTTRLCRNQFALVNRACAMIPNTTPIPQPAPPVPTPAPPGPTPTPPDPTPTPPCPAPGPDVPSPTPAPLPTEEGERLCGHHGHHNHHHHHHPRNTTGTPAEEECCRWLQEVESVCVCSVLAHLPTFMSKPKHNYAVMVGDTCAVTFECAPRVLLP